MLPHPTSHPVCQWRMTAQLNLFSLILTLDPKMEKMEMECVSFTLPQQFNPKYKYPGNQNSEEDLLRTCESTFISSVCKITQGSVELFCFILLPFKPSFTRTKGHYHSLWQFHLSVLVATNDNLNNTFWIIRGRELDLIINLPTSLYCLYLFIFYSFLFIAIEDSLVILLLLF